MLSGQSTFTITVYNFGYFVFFSHFNDNDRSKLLLEGLSRTCSGTSEISIPRGTSHIMANILCDGLCEKCNGGSEC